MKIKLLYGFIPLIIVSVRSFMLRGNKFRIIPFLMFVKDTELDSINLDLELEIIKVRTGVALGFYDITNVAITRDLMIILKAHEILCTSKDGSFDIGDATRIYYILRKRDDVPMSTANNFRSIVTKYYINI